MLGLKFKKREKPQEETPAVAVAENKNELAVVEKETAVTPEVVSTEVAVTEDAKTPTEMAVKEEPLIGIKFRSQEEFEKMQSLSDFARLAAILDKDELTVLEECKIYQIKKIMSRVEQAVVRYGVSDDAARGIINDAITVNYGGIAVSPAYINTFAENFRDGEEVKVSAVIDFPFGESSFKVKYAEMKNAVKAGVDEILVVFPTQLLKTDKESVKELKKEMRKIRHLGRVDKGVAINAEDVSGEDIKRFIRLAEKRKMKFVTFLFGNVTAKQLCDKMQEIVAYKNRAAIKVMANVEDVEGVKTLVQQKADGIITPFADKIAQDLFAQFKITKTKLS